MTTTKVKLITPSTPNFIRMEGTDRAIPVSNLTDSELRELGRAWTQALINKSHAQEQRRNKRKL